MTKEERKSHAAEISGIYVAKISPDDTDEMKELAALPIQDIITVYSNAHYALESGMFFEGVNPEALQAGEERAVRYRDAIEHVKKIVVERLKNSTVWTMIDNITKSPFIDSTDAVWVFTEKAYADDVLDYYMQQYRTTFEVLEIPKDEVINFFAVTGYMRGAKMFLVDNGAYAKMNVFREDIIDPPNFGDAPDINKPVMNPDIFRAVAKFDEERYYRLGYEGKEQVLYNLEGDMIKAMGSGRFLVPVKGLETLVDNTVEEGNNILIPFLSLGKEENQITTTPAFTDWVEFNKVYSQDEWHGWILSLEDLLSSPEDAVCLNPGSFAFVMTKRMIQQMIDINKTE